MITIVKNNSKVAYGVNKYLCDDYNDLLNIKYAEPGSTAFLADTIQYFILNNDYEWMEIPDPDDEILDFLGTGILK